MNKSLMLAVIATMALAGTAHAQGITVDQAWARATSPSQTVGGVFLTITDKGTPDTLVSASSPIADMLELHETVADNGVMKMRPIAGLPVAAGQSVVLKPGSYHLMAMGLKQPLTPGYQFPVTLNFAKAGAVTVTGIVASAGASGPEPMSLEHLKNAPMPMDHGSMDHMDHSGMSMPKP